VLVEHGGPPSVVTLVARAGEFAAEPVAAQPDAEHQPTAAEPVQRHGLPRDLGRPPARQRRDHRAEQQPFGHRGRRGERDPRVGHRPDR
jgi:hypothetical protein